MLLKANCVELMIPLLCCGLPLFLVQSKGLIDSSARWRYLETR